VNKLTCVCFLLSLGVPMSSLGESNRPIPLCPHGTESVVVQKVSVEDCRVVRGFLGTPVDGSVRSWDYRGRVSEYPRTAGDGVVYSYNSNDGLHITLGDDDGFDAVVLRGGAKTRMYGDVSSLTEPQRDRPLHEFPGSKAAQSVYFDKRIKAKKVSLFGTKGGTISDIGFYRIRKGTLTSEGAELSSVADGTVELPKPGSKFAPESLYLAMAERYGERDRRTVALVQGKRGGPPVQVQRDRAVHFITPPFQEEKGLAAITLEAKVSGASGPLAFTVVVQDPLDPRLDLVWLVFSATESGMLRLDLDIPDQVLFKGSQLWLTLRFDRDAVLAGPRGRAPQLWLHFVPRENALPEALSRRKMLMKTFFSLLSEPRPWGGYRKQSREQFYASSPYAGQCPELFMTIDECYELDPSDDIVRQYREWVYLRNLDSLSDVPPPPPPPEGVPAWAWYPRLAWLETRRIAEWWLEERLVPTGEFGGRVGDDSDFYQQFTDLPFFEKGGVAAKMMDSAARMAELAEKENLRRGINIHTTDALHAYEEGINHLALMARWFHGDPIYLERCMESARNMEELTIVTKDGRRHFRNRERMGARDLERASEPAVDGGATPLMWHTALQVADYNRNPRAIKILREWADSWLKFMKPGQWASAVDVVSGKVIDSEKNRPLYGGYRSQASVFTWLYGLTKDKRYVEPFLYYYRRGQAPYPANGFLSDVYSLGGLTDLEQRTPEKLAAHNPAAALYMTGDVKPLVRGMIGNPRGWQAEISNLYDARRWPDMYTTTHQFTDRIFPSLLQHASISYLGGFCRRNKFNPTLAASWEGFGTDYAALVLVNQPDRVKVAVYSFAEAPMQGKMRVWALEHGHYKVAIGPDASDDNEMDRIEKTGTVELAKADAIDVALPPRAVTIVQIDQVERLESIFARPDLAIAAREVKIEGNALTGTVHNIGSANAAEVTVAVLDASGQVIASKSLGKLAAPVDLLPKRTSFSLRLPARAGRGWRLVVDPDRRIPEIYEGNNEVALDRLLAVNYAKGWDWSTFRRGRRNQAIRSLWRFAE